jgi:hypothetical protein
MLSEVDAKFSKFVDKECDVINGEVKKWFKKLSVRRNAPFFDLCGAESIRAERGEGSRREDRKCQRENQAGGYVHVALDCCTSP